MQPIPQNRWGFFVTGIGEFTKVNDTSEARGFYLPTGGVIFGADYRVSPHFAIGLTGGYALRMEIYFIAVSTLMAEQSEPTRPRSVAGSTSTRP